MTLHRHVKPGPPISCILVGKGMRVAHVVLACRVVLCTVVLLVNTFIIVAIWSRRRFHTTRSHLFVLNLSVCALIGGLVELLCVIIDSICPLATYVSWSEVFCFIKTFLFLLVWSAIVVVIGVIELDRYILIVHSLRYMAIMTKRKVAALIAGSWIISGIASMVVVLLCDWAPGVSCGVDLIPSSGQLILQVTMNIAVMVIVFFTHFRIRAEVAKSRENHPPVIAPAFSSAGPTRDAEWARLSGKSVKIITQVVACYILIFIPVQVVLLLDMLEVGSEEIRSVAMSFTFCFFILSFLVNPFVYTWRNSKLRTDMYIVWIKLSTMVSISLRVTSRTTQTPALRV